MTPSFNAPPVPQRFFSAVAEFLERVFGQRHAGDGGHRLAATALALATYAGNAIAIRDQGLFAGTGVHRLTTVRTVTTCVGGKYQATKGGEGCGFFGHRQSSYGGQKIGRYLTLLRQGIPTAKPHSGRGSATQGGETA